MATLTKSYEFCQDLKLTLPALTILMNAPARTRDLAIKMGVPYQNVYHLVLNLSNDGLLRLPSGKSTEFTLTPAGEAILQQLQLHLSQP